MGYDYLPKINILLDSYLQPFGMNEYGGRRQKDDNMTDKFFVDIFEWLQTQ